MTNNYYYKHLLVGGVHLTLSRAWRSFRTNTNLQWNKSVSTVSNLVSYASGITKGAGAMQSFKSLNLRFELCIFFSENWALTQCLTISECPGMTNKRWKCELLWKTTFALSMYQSPHQLHWAVPGLREEMTRVNPTSESSFWLLLSLVFLPSSINSFFSPLLLGIFFRVVRYLIGHNWAIKQKLLQSHFSEVTLKLSFICCHLIDNLN